MSRRAPRVKRDITVIVDELIALERTFDEQSSALVEQAAALGFNPAQVQQMMSLKNQFNDVVAEGAAMRRLPKEQVQSAPPVPISQTEAEVQTQHADVRDGASAHNSENRPAHPVDGTAGASSDHALAPAASDSHPDHWTDAPRTAGADAGEMPGFLRRQQEQHEA